MSKALPAPHLIADGDLKRCSVCNQPFFPNERPPVEARL
jgi:hypothetical protein